MKNRVYVIQRQQRIDRRDGSLVDRYDSISSASEFGELVYLLSPTASPFNPEQVITELKNKLVVFNGDTDYLLLIGNPCLIGWAVAIASQYSGGKVSLLQWSGRENKYLKIVARGLRIDPSV